MANKLLLGILSLVLYTGTNYTTTRSKAISGDQICGKWQNTEKNLIVQVYREDDEFKAKVVWFDNGDGEQSMYNYRDKRNPDASLRNRKVLGMNVMEDLEYMPESNSWENGIIYDASSGRTWSSCAKIDDDGSLKVKGYWKFKFIGKTMTFKRI